MPCAGRPGLGRSGCSRRPRMRIVRLQHAARLEQVGSAVSTSAVAPQATASRAISSVSGNTARTRSMSCSTATTVRSSPCQRRTRSSRSAAVLASMAVRGSSSRITPASCSSRRAKSARCICPPERLPMGRRSNPVRPTAARASSIRTRSARPMLPNRPDHRHRPIGDEVVDADRERPVDLGGLGQIGDALACASRPQWTRRVAQSRRRCPSAASTCPRRSGQRRPSGCPARTSPLEMMHGRMPVIAERHVLEADRGCLHRDPSVRAQSTSAHNSADSTAGPGQPLQRRRAAGATARRATARWRMRMLAVRMVLVT